MRILLMMRHAKSSWNDVSLSDFERPLNARGIGAASLIGRYISENDLRPDAILSSPAARAAKTALIVAENIHRQNEIKFDERIYEADVARLQETLGEQNNERHSILLIGHNPGMEQLIRMLTGEQQAMPTAALAVIDLEIESWRDIKFAKGVLRTIVRPKEIKNGE